jgi:hypothetical protein
MNDFCIAVIIFCRFLFAMAIGFYTLVANVQDYHKAFCCFCIWYIFNEWYKSIDN